MKRIIDIFKVNAKNKSISYAFEGEIKRRKFEYKSALSDFNKAIRLDSKNPDFYMLRALVKLELNDLKNALKDINKSIHLNKDYNWYYIHKYTIQKRMGLKEEAKKDLLLVEKNNDNNLDSLFYYLYELEIKENNINDAIYFLDKALSKNPKNEKLLHKKINLLCHIGNFEIAANDTKRLIKLNSNNHKYYYINSVIYVNLGKYEDALVYSNKAIELCDTNDWYYALRAKIKNSLQDYPSALIDIDTAINIDNKPSFYFKLRDDLLMKIEQTKIENEKNI